MYVSTSGRPAGAGRPLRLSRSGALVRLGQLRGLRALDLAGRRLPGLDVGLLVVLQRLVDELAELDVALLDADAVGLLGELVADELEGAVGLGDEAEQDDVVR